MTPTPHATELSLPFKFYCLRTRVNSMKADKASNLNKSTIIEVTIIKIFKLEFSKT